MSEELYWLGFAVFPGIGPKRFRELLDHFITAEKAWNAGEGELETILKPALTKQFLSFRSTFGLQKYSEQLERRNIFFIPQTSDLYPQFLLSIENPPIVLFYKGENLLNTEQKKVAVVGTRKITSYGKLVTEMLTRELVDSGCAIVSGLALGIDACAHMTTLENNGETIAVLGCGIECCYPSTNQNIYNSILSSGGMILSEFPLNQPPSKGSFPSRNRIIAALSDALIITEGAEDSGSLITAEFGLQFRKPVFAVPGPITSQLSRGPLKLIHKGARLATSAKDILSSLGVKGDKGVKPVKSIKGDTKEEQKIIDLLENESLSFDEIVKRTKHDVSHLSSLLSVMEIKGIVKNSENGYGLN